MKRICHAIRLKPGDRRFPGLTPSTPLIDTVEPIDLTEETNEILENIKPTKRVSKPPPIILYGIMDLTQLTELLNSSVPPGSYSYRIVNRNQLRLMVKPMRCTRTQLKLFERMDSDAIPSHKKKKDVVEL
ncbi:hypothetical protein B5X24_HaOG211845 [Helicoverpa armigera]|nr:hypothetical protein B5X24_HaOG211845 [Helicoverpa armigera]